MKTYRVTLNIGTSARLDADSWRKEGDQIRLVKSGEVIASYHFRTVRCIEDCTKGRQEYLEA